MHFVFSGVFWGLILVLLGLSMIVKVVFKIDLPIIKLLFAALLIYWGIKLLFGISFHTKSPDSVVFDNADIEHVEAGREYNVVFGKSRIDLRNFVLEDKNAKIEIDVVFGNGIIYLNPEIPAKVKVDAVFAECRLPKGNVSFIGEQVYHTPSFVEGENFLQIDLDIVFGNAVVRY